MWYVNISIFFCCLQTNGWVLLENVIMYMIIGSYILEHLLVPNAKLNMYVFLKYYIKKDRQIKRKNLNIIV